VGSREENFVLRQVFGRAVFGLTAKIIRKIIDDECAKKSPANELAGLLGCGL
jgi:hypothetical protein